MSSIGDSGDVEINGGGNDYVSPPDPIPVRGRLKNDIHMYGYKFTAGRILDMDKRHDGTYSYVVGHGHVHTLKSSEVEEVFTINIKGLIRLLEKADPELEVLTSGGSICGIEIEKTHVNLLQDVKKNE